MWPSLLNDRPVGVSERGLMTASAAPPRGDDGEHQSRLQEPRRRPASGAEPSLPVTQYPDGPRRGSSRPETDEEPAHALSTSRWHFPRTDFTVPGVPQLGARKIAESVLACGGCEQAHSAGGLDGFGPGVRAELGVQVAQVGLDGGGGDGQLGRRALPQADRTLRAIGVISAWRLLHDIESGIAWLPGRRADPGRLAGSLRSISPGPVGMSPCFDNLLHSPRFLRLARVALRSAIQAQPVVLFADDPLATAAAADPEVMRRVAATVLAPLTRSRHRTDDIAQHARDLA
jgi:hypothetical protein